MCVRVSRCCVLRDVLMKNQLLPTATLLHFAKLAKRGGFSIIFSFSPAVCTAVADEGNSFLSRRSSIYRGGGFCGGFSECINASLLCSCDHILSSLAWPWRWSTTYHTFIPVPTVYLSFFSPVWLWTHQKWHRHQFFSVVASTFSVVCAPLSHGDHYHSL